MPSQLALLHAASSPSTCYDGASFAHALPWAVRGLQGAHASFNCNRSTAAVIAHFLQGAAPDIGKWSPQLAALQQ